MQEHVQSPKSENLTRLADGDELALRAASVVDSYQVGHERAEADRLAGRTRTYERPLMRHEELDRISRHLAHYRLISIEEQQQSRRKPDDYGLIA